MNSCFCPVSQMIDCFFTITGEGSKYLHEPQLHFSGLMALIRKTHTHTKIPIK